MIFKTRTRLKSIIYRAAVARVNLHRYRKEPGQAQLEKAI